MKRIIRKNTTMDVVGTKVLRLVLLAIHSHLFYGFLPRPPPPSSKSGLKLVYNVNIVYRNLKSEIKPRNLNEIVRS
jgi:hypothetical protein